jgi:hypothetical protein
MGTPAVNKSRLYIYERGWPTLWLARVAPNQPVPSVTLMVDCSGTLDALGHGRKLSPIFV